MIILIVRANITGKMKTQFALFKKSLLKKKTILKSRKVISKAGERIKITVTHLCRKF